MFARIQEVLVKDDCEEIHRRVTKDLIDRPYAKQAVRDKQIGYLPGIVEGCEELVENPEKDC